jgi:hypothetical protein
MALALIYKRILTKILLSLISEIGDFTSFLTFYFFYINP